MDELSLEDSPVELMDALRLALENLLSILLSLLPSTTSDDDMTILSVQRVRSIADLELRYLSVGEVISELIRQRFTHGMKDDDVEGLGEFAKDRGVEDGVADGGLGKVDDGLPVSLPVALLIGDAGAFEGVHHADGWDVLDRGVKDVFDGTEPLFKELDGVL